MRRTLLRGLAGLTGAAFAAVAFPAIAQTASPATDVTAAMADRVMGNPEAPVTLIEYASFTCPVCARFHETILPQLKADFIDTGKLRIIFREFPRDAVDLRAALTARCTSPERYFGLAGAIFKSQQTWMKAPDPLKAMLQNARLAGLGEAQVQACLTSEPMQRALVERRMEAIRTYRVEAVPAFIAPGGQALQIRRMEYQEFVDALARLGVRK